MVPNEPTSAMSRWDAVTESLSERGDRADAMARIALGAIVAVTIVGAAVALEYGGPPVEDSKLNIWVVLLLRVAIGTFVFLMDQVALEIYKANRAIAVSCWGRADALRLLDPSDASASHAFESLVEWSIPWGDAERGARKVRGIVRGVARATARED